MFIELGTTGTYLVWLWSFAAVIVILDKVLWVLEGLEEMYEQRQWDKQVNVNLRKLEEYDKLRKEL